MVEVASDVGDGVVYDVPFFKLAGGIASKLNAAPVPSDEDAHPLAMHLQRHITGIEHNGEKFRSVKVISTGNMHYETILGLPAVLQDTYDHLPGAQERPPVRFFSAIAVEYGHGGRNKVDLLCFESDRWRDEQVRTNLEDLYERMEKGVTDGADIGVVPLLIAASTEPELSLPAERMKKSLSWAQGSMFDRSRYESGKHMINDKEYVIGKKLLPNPSEAADRLLPLVARVYDHTMFSRETKEGEAYILGDVAFNTLERAEMPDRYKGLPPND